MTTGVSSTNNANPAAPVINAASANGATVNGSGLAGVSSSIASAAATGQGCSAQISSWFSWIVDNIRNCLAKLPLIGSWFESAQTTPVSSSSPINPPISTNVVWTDAELVDMIRGQFVPAPATGATTAAPGVPEADVVAYTVGLFGQITSHSAKMDAFLTVLTAANSTDDISRQFYNALPEGIAGTFEASKDAFKERLWIVNGRRDDGQGLNFGQYVVNNAIRGPMAKQAAEAMRNAFLVKDLQNTLNDPAATNDQTKHAYEALPADVKTMLREQIWIANGRNDNGQGTNYGHLVMTNTPRHLNVVNAAAALYRILVAG